MSTIYHLINRNRIGPAPERNDFDLPGSSEKERRFSGALDDARRDLQRDLDRRDRERQDRQDRERKWTPDPGHVDVLDARSRLDRSGARLPGGVPATTRDGPPRPIEISSASASTQPQDDTAPLVVPRPDARDSSPPPRRGDTQRFKAVREQGAPKRNIPPPPMPGSATRRRRQTMSFAARSGAQPPPPPNGPLTRRHRVNADASATGAATHTRGAPPSRSGNNVTKIVIPPTEASESESTGVWSRDALRSTGGLPPLPDWGGGEGPEPTMERLIVDDGPAANDTSLPPAPDPETEFEAEFGAEFEAEFEQEPEANLEEVELSTPAKRAARGEPAAETMSGIRRMLRGPLRAYASMSKFVQTLSAGTDEPPAPTAPTPVVEAPLTIGEPISADLGLTASAMEQLAGPGVLHPSGRNVRASVGGRVIADRFIDAAALDPADAETRLGRLGPKRAEVTVGAGEDKIGLAITTAGGHVSVEAQVPDDQMAELMKRRLDDLKDALERHDLELSDMTFGEASQEHTHPDGEPLKAANDSGEPEATESEPIHRRGFRTVA